MINCPHCGHSNRLSAKFCGNCGKPLSAPEQTPAIAEPTTIQQAPDSQSPDVSASPEQESPSASSEQSQAIVTDTDAPTLAAPSETIAESNSAASQEGAIAVETNEQPAAESPTNTSAESANAPMPTAALDDSSAENATSAASPTMIASVTEQVTPLEIGAVLQERFTILEIVSQANDVITYRARDAWRCPTCDFVNEADAVFCSNCGRELSERGAALLLERENSVEISPSPDFVLNTRAYQIQTDVSTTAALAPSERRIRLQYAVASDVGVVRGSAREPNEDSAFALALSAVHESEPQPTIGLLIIADGIGGSEAGELASKKAIQVLSTLLLNNIITPVLQGQALDDDAAREKIRAAILEANLQVMQLAAEKQNDMGTTVTLALILDTRAYIANVGDSRTYLLRDAKLAPVTQDHSLVASLVSANMLKPEEVYAHPQRNIILRSLGANAELEVDIYPLEGGALSLQAGDRLLLCSDGLWEMVRDFDLESILLREGDLNKAAASLIAAANEGGGEDNVSLILVSSLASGDSPQRVGGVLK